MEENKLQQNEVKQAGWKKPVKIVLNVLFYTIVILLLLFALATAIGNVKQKNRRKAAEQAGTVVQDYNIPTLFGIGLLSVQSDSMDMTTGNDGTVPIKKDSFLIGDLLVVKTATKGRIAKIEKEKTIVTYYDVIENKLITHRVVDIIDNPDGSKSYATQGDRIEVINPGANYDDPSDTYQVTIIRDNEIIAIYSSKVKGGGSFLEFLQTRLGLGLCVLLPCFLFLIFEVFVLVRNIFAINKEKMQEELANQPKFDAEAEKEKIRQQILAEMAAQEKAKAEAPAEEKAEEPKEEALEDKGEEHKEEKPNQE